ncbi:hypothetical protein [Ruminococcus sp. AF20-12LB]|uniref:hypothetical protein n=1 Tax=Ruminococcus sp. AF20-12LB TaxID=2293160 RepID=UPI0015FD356F|nr:hypothetical protein [Ruminococcus sp. AF20-12LB]
MFYEAGMSLRVIADELGLNSIKVRKLFITAGVYASDVADKISVGAERQRRYRAMKRWRNATTEEGSADVRITARSK